MPNYDFQCHYCNHTEYNVRISAEVVNTNPNWNKVQCPKCRNLMGVAFLGKPPGIKFIGEPPLGEQSKQKRFAEKQEAIYNEGFTCKSELQEGLEMAKEEEKKRELTPGTLSTGVKATGNKEQLQKRMAKKMDESRKQRKKIV